MCKLDYMELGGTLFVPALHKELEKILLENKYPNLKSLVIDTEDGLQEELLQEGVHRIERLLLKIQNPTIHIFLRPRNVETLQTFLTLEGINNIRGFLLPKFSLTNAKEYLQLLDKTQHLFMPSIEGSELFHQDELRALKDLLLQHKERVVIVRFGLEDMLSALSMRRNCEESIFDFSATNVVLGNFIATFKSAGFGISGGVYPCFKENEGFIKDAKRDLKEGLFSKTIIHPNQIDILHELYKVNQKELQEALAIEAKEEAVFAMHEKMLERSTMYKHSLSIIQRSKYYGVIKEQ